jgi:DNA-binding NtrC family response regulator
MVAKDPPIYVVDDDPSVREAVGSLIRSAGFRVEMFASAHEFLASRWADVPSCLVLDVRLPGLSGLELQQQLVKAGRPNSIIFLTGHGDIPTSVRAMKAGAMEFLTKPWADADLISAIRQGLDRTCNSARPSVMEEPDSTPGRGRVIGESAAWREVLMKATQVAATETTVFLQGPSGTGKEVVARFIHRASARKRGPFVAINCAAMPEQLLESELFGYEKGAFTGASQSKPGQIELASGGVLFLDEVSEMSLLAQTKFLRFLQEREYQRLGGTRLLKANVRVIAASNRDVRQAVERGSFREDLYYRLLVFDISIPPLRERASDISLLAEAFLSDFARSQGRRSPATLSHEAHQLLLAHQWPGNVRELRNVLERAAILCDGGLITREHLSLPTSTAQVLPATTDLSEMERRTIQKVMRETHWNKSHAASRLGLTRTQLYVRLRRYGLRPPTVLDC